jgi:hypothetical protein
MGPKRTRFATMEGIKLNVTAEFGRFQKKPFACASNNGRIHGARERVHAQYHHPENILTPHHIFHYISK